MKIKTISFLAAAAVAALFAGCEWTSSDGDPTWSGSYGEGGEMVKEMNFSGTYRNDARGGCAIVTKGASQESVQQNLNSGAKIEKFSAWMPNSSTSVTLSNTPDPTTVSVSVSLSCYDQYKGEMIKKQWSWINDGAGNLQGDTEAAGRGKVNGNQVILYDYTFQGTEKDVVTVSYIAKSVEQTTTPSAGVNGNVTSITVSQSGSNIKLHTSNGVTMSGSITTVNVYSNSTATTYNAQFNASSSGNSIVGTIDNRTGQNRLDATWTSGQFIYDVNGFSATSTGSSSAE